MAKRNIIVIGGSTGSFEVFKRIAAGLPKGLDAALFIVWHMPPTIEGVLRQVLNRLSGLEVIEPRDDEPIKMGRIYVAVPDHHLLIEDSRVRITRGPKENRFRPAVDPLFRSAAYSYGPRVIGIVTSGALDDGTAGLGEIKRRGGITVAQDPEDAEISSMPRSAIDQIGVDHIARGDKLADLILRLSQQDAAPDASELVERNGNHDRTAQEIRIAAEENALSTGVYQSGQLTHFTCPECSGVLARLPDDDLIRFRCHTGHAFSADSLLASLTEEIESSLWGAIRGIDESIMLLNHIGDHFAEANRGSLAAKFFQKANEAEGRNELIRQAVLDHELLTTEAIERDPTTLPPADSHLNAAGGVEGIN